MRVTEAQKLTVGCPTCHRDVGKPCRSSRIPGPNSFGGGWGGPPDLDRAHDARRAAFLDSQALLARLQREAKAAKLPCRNPECPLDHCGGCNAHAADMEGHMATCPRCQDDACAVCGKQMEAADQAAFEAEGGEGMPRCHADCAALEVMGLCVAAAERAAGWDPNP